MNVLLIYPVSSGMISLAGRNAAMRISGKWSYSPPLGLVTLAALLPQDWRFQLVDLSFQQISTQQWEESDLVLISGTVLHLAHVLELIREAKRRKKIVGVGGPGVFHYPEIAVQAGADFVVRGEAEPAVPLILKALDEKRTGLIIDKDRPSELSESPTPRFDLLDMSAYVDMSIQFSRGCPFECEFCDASKMFGRQVRTKGPAQVLTELQALYDLGWRRQIFIVDDNFIGSVSKAGSLMTALIPWMEEHDRPFDFLTQASVDLAKYPQLMDSMVKAGFAAVFLGIETPSKEVLEGIGKTQNVRADLYGVCKAINEAGLEVMAGTIVGLDGERPGNDQCIIDFVTETGIPLVDVELVHAFPGTTLWDRMRKEGRLLFGSDFDPGKQQDYTLNILPLRPMNEVINEYLHAIETLYEPSIFLERTFNHFMAMSKMPFSAKPPRPDAHEVILFFYLCARWGVAWPTRTKFWKYLGTILWKCGRKRAYRFLRCCTFFDHHLQVRERAVEFFRGNTFAIDTTSQVESEHST